MTPSLQDLIALAKKLEEALPECYVQNHLISGRVDFREWDGVIYHEIDGEKDGIFCMTLGLVFELQDGINWKKLTLDVPGVTFGMVYYDGYQDLLLCCILWEDESLVFRPRTSMQQLNVHIERRIQEERRK